MQVVECFFKPGHKGSAETLDMLQNAVKTREDIVFIASNVDTGAGRRRAEAHGVATAPTTVVNGQHVIEGVPYNMEELLQRLQE